MQGMNGEGERKKRMKEVNGEKESEGEMGTGKEREKGGRCHFFSAMYCYIRSLGRFIFIMFLPSSASPKVRRIGII